MPDIDPSTLTRTDIFSQPLPPPPLSSKLNGASALASQKAAKAATTAQRIDLEPFYTNLKNTIGEHWAEYKEAVNQFLLGMIQDRDHSMRREDWKPTANIKYNTGQLNQNELCLRTDYFLTTNPHTEHLHNQFIAAIFANVGREPPDVGIAPWVSANDKPTVPSKPVSGDGAEQRLKTEVMQLPARDRRRLKDISDVSSGVSFNTEESHRISYSFSHSFIHQNLALIRTYLPRLTSLIPTSPPCRNTTLQSNFGSQMPSQQALGA